MLKPLPLARPANNDRAAMRLRAIGASIQRLMELQTITILPPGRLYTVRCGLITIYIFIMYHIKVYVNMVL